MVRGGKAGLGESRGEEVNHQGGDEELNNLGWKVVFLLAVKYIS